MSNLIAHLPLNNSKEDLCGNQWSTHGTVVYQTKDNKTGIKISNDYLYINKNLFNFGKDDFTVNFNMYLLSKPTVQTRLLDTSNNWNTFAQYFIGIYPDGNFVFSTYHTDGSYGGTNYFTNNFEEFINKWVNITCLRINGVYQLYFDGVLISENNNNIDKQISNNNKNIFRLSSNDNYQPTDSLLADFKLAEGIIFNKNIYKVGDSIYGKQN